MQPGECYRFSTPAKINLFLRIQKKRPDGYHELLLDFLPISLFDHIILQWSVSNRLELEGNLENLELEQNLIIKAVRIMERETGQPIPLRIQLEKQIPSGAGLGGGSGNAAGVLVVLNRLLELSLSEPKLKELALQLGADVPFFISPQPSLARGIGEKLSPLPDFGPLHLLLIHPGFAISTAEAYQTCHISGQAAPIAQYHMEDIARLQPEMNDFWDPLSSCYPELETCRTALMRLGARAAGLSGSGSTVFGIFDTKINRDLASISLKKENGWRVFSCETLSGFSYPAENT
jgi:4-diphosphocytidyl-2-C-methyl-D-erythritol kinase